MIKYDDVQNHAKPFLRKIAFREYGDAYSENILVCIPGLLESQNAFDEIVNFVEQYEGCRLITFDHCGRGMSDWLDESDTYKMSIYLKDLKTLINYLHATHKRLIRNLYLLGSSMGGLLALNLIAQKQLRIKGLILNDVGLTVSWKGLYSLYSEKQNAKINYGNHPFKRLNFDPRLIKHVRNPGHVDLRYRINFHGLHFENRLREFHGPILLLRGGKSKICSIVDEKVLKRYARNAEIMLLEKEDHPVGYGPEVLSKLSDILKLRKTSLSLSSDMFSTEYQMTNKIKMLNCN